MCNMFTNEWTMQEAMITENNNKRKKKRILRTEECDKE